MGKLIKPLTPHEIYLALTTGPGSSLLDDGQAAANREFETERYRADLISRQAALVQSGWEGTASDDATGAVRPLVASASFGAARLAVAKEMMDRQSESFHNAANSVRPMPSEPPAPDISDPMWPFVDYEKQVTDYQADTQHNINVFRGYDSASEFHEQAMGEYTTTDDIGGTISVTDGGDYIEVPDGGQPRDRDQFGPPPGGHRDPGSVPAGGPPVGGPPVSGLGSQQPQQTSPSDFVTRPVGTPGHLVPGGQPVPTGQTSGGPMPGGFVPGVGLTPGGPGSTGGSGPRGTYGGGPGSGGPGTTGRGPAMRAGMLGAGALAAEGARLNGRLRRLPHVAARG